MPDLKPKQEAGPRPAATGTVKLIRKTRQATRKQYMAEEKIRIVMEGIRGEEPVSTVCRREGLPTSVYYRWLNESVEADKLRLEGEDTRGATRSEVADLKRENERLKQLVAKLALDNMVLRKSLLSS